MALRQRSELARRAERADPRRRQLAGAGDALGRPRRAGLHAQRQRLDDRGRRREPLRRLGAELGAARLRPRRPRDARRDRGGARSAGRRFGAPTEAEVELAEEIVDAVPSVEMVRLVSSGTEAAMSAVRLARGSTRRDRILKFSGCYHGHVDALLASAGSGLATLGIPSSPGVPTGVDRGHDRHDLQRRRRGRGRRRALRRGARGDPRRARRGEHGRRPARRRASSRRCARSATPRGALLVFDEVITGFRVARGGAQERYGVAARPDDPRQDRRRRPARRGVRRPRRRDGAARAGRRRLPGGHALREPARDGRRDLGAPAPARPGRLRGARGEGRAARGGAARRSAACIASARWRRSSWRSGGIRNFADAKRCDTERYGALFRHLLERGIYIAPSQFECLFVSLAHSDEDIDRTIEAVADFFGA